MRPFLLATLACLPLLAGCIGGSGDGDRDASSDRLVPADVVAPPQSTVAAVEGGVAALFDSVALPFEATFTLPPKATMVRLVAEDGASVSLRNEETGRRRCNNPTVDSFSAAFDTPKSCSSIAALDEPGTAWVASVGGTGNSAVRIEFLDAPLDGLAGQLDLDLISPPTLGVQPTETLFLPSFDGVELRVEVTLPEGDGPWPVIIESSPYHDDFIRALPASYGYFAEDWARRGYAIVVADVRGFGDSGGCVEVWGRNEQRDQLVLVEWAAQQPWSDGNVGFYGQSYVGTTPVEAAVQAPEALKAIIAVAPVINAYEDWHHGGVPNGESRLSPVAYQVLTEGVVNAPAAVQEGNFRTDPELLVNNAVNGPCDPTLVVRANDPRATYGPFYEERDFKKRAGDVKAAVLYTQGFEDANVKSAMIPGWFNDLTSPKLGLFGHWLHQHPSRLDCEALFIGWFEQHLKGKPIGFEALPAAAIQVDRDTHRTAQQWPPLAPLTTTFYPDFGGQQLGDQPADGEATVFLDQSAGAANQVTGAQGQPQAVLRTTLAHDVSLAGTAFVRVVGNLEGASNAYLAADLYEGDSLLTWGQLNLAHNADHTQYTPVTPVTVIDAQLPMLPTERLLRAGTELTLVLRGASIAESTDPFGAGGVRFTFWGGDNGTELHLPGVDPSEYEPIPLTARP